MRKVGYVLAVAAMVGSAHAAPPGPEYRTVSWFVDNPTAMRGVLKLCRDHVGLAVRNPTCINADEASGILATREMVRSSGLATVSPLNPKYWDQRPGERETKIRICAMKDRSGAQRPEIEQRVCAAAGG